MRNGLVVVAMAGLLAACSDGASLATGPARGPTEAPTPLWQGGRQCAAGAVRVEVEGLAPLLESDAVFHGSLIVRLAIDGRDIGAPAGGLFRSRLGTERGVGAAEMVEVYTGLGGECDWIAAYRVR